MVCLEGFALCMDGYPMRRPLLTQKMPRILTSRPMLFGINRSILLDKSIVSPFCLA